ncbi:DUF6489 family protein [Sphingomonas bacterium]|uniref:DUF6489 family protein n=1 Tax=Sphingomonas bacterium TaxID=1895847 RepID=UPI001575B5B3|nr:DUF6489 family protein [Sphingomonas bacterium]
MKVTIDLDLTPAEARAAMGLPDLAPVHERYVQLLLDATDATALKPEAIDALVKSWAPMGEAGMALWRRLIETGAKPG